MADWTSIDPNALLPGAPWTSPLAQAAFENPEAIAEGAAGAPRIRAAAMAGSVAGDELLFGTGGTGVVFTAVGGDGEVFFPEGSFRAIASCTVRVSAEYARTGGAQNVTLRVRKNGTAALTQTKSGTDYSTHSVDISLVPGDIIRVSGQGSPAVDTPATDASIANIRNVRYMVGSVKTVGGI